MVSEPWSSTMDSTTNPAQNAFNTATSQSPLMLLNNMSNLMSTKLDSSNYMIWKLQISAVLDAYSVIDHLDGSTSQPSQFLTSETGMQLSSPVLAMVVGLSTSQEVWDKLEERFTCTARANVLNLKLELQAIKKGNESVNSYLQRIKTVRDKLSAVGVQSDPEELLHVILKGLPKEYAPFASAIRTRDGVLSLEKLSVLLQTEEQSMQESVDPFSNSALAMFVTPNKPPNGYNGNHGYNNNRGRGGRNSYSRGRGGRSSNFTSNFNTPSFNAPQSNFQQSQSAPQAKSDRPTCQICWKQGHYAIDCYHRMDFAYQGKNPTTKLAAMASASNLQHTQSAETWLTDSGASDHISASSTNLSPQVPYHGQEQVSVGNGQQVPIQTIGLIHAPDTSASTASAPISSDTWLNTLLSLHNCSHTTAVNPSLSSELCPAPIDQSHPSADSDIPAPNPTQLSIPTPHSISLPNSPTILPTDTASISLLFLSHPMQTRSKSGIFKPKVSYTAQVDSTLTEPTSYTAASKHPQWCTAMTEEFQALHKQGTWTLVPPPPSKNIVGCKWVYKLKYHSDGTLARHKAKLVAKGFHQQHGVDFDETFSPVVKAPTVRLILSLAVSLGWSLRQLDVKNAFLHGSLKEEVYMTQPQGYIDPQHPSHVCKLLKSIYGLKQAPRAWFESFTSQLLHLGFTASTADSSLFIYKHNSIIAYLLLYVDDIVLTSNTPAYLDQLVTQLSTVFDLKDLGSLHYFLGLQVTRSSTGLYLNQAKYAHDLLKKHNMLDSKPASSPSCPNTRLSLHEDISFSVHQVCQYMSTPTSTHLAAAKRILRYIRGTLNHGIAFTPGSLHLSAYTDADWAGDPDDRRSTSGYIVYLGSNPITWSAKKQPTVSRSSTESEYRALAIASAELCWMRTLLKDLGIFLSHTPILWCDNVSALAIASNPVFHARTKHIEVDFHFVRERVLRKDLLVQFVSTLDQLADIFTKSLPTRRFVELQRNLMVSVPAIEGG
uniref:Reverse transcriptase Ty1/copia-type domain-containing protein n=1 Tax=Fagus sylvatica TaxID=28930 RepID=A0A2N9FBP7_FAGSY